MTECRVLGDRWVVRWDTAADESPRVLHAGSPGEATLWRGAAGHFAILDGYVFDAPAMGDDASRGSAWVVARAYDRWGERFLEQISGGFAAVVWDPARRRLIVGRDALGLGPCFYWYDGRVLLAATSIDALLCRPEVPCRFDRVVLAEYVQDSVLLPQREETFYEGVRRVPAAHRLALGDRGLEIERYWDPVPPGFSWASLEEMEEFAPRLERAVARCLAVGGDSVALSGGFDSVSVAAVAAEQRRGQAPLTAVSLRFAGTVCDEGPSQIAVAQALGMPQVIRTLEESLGGESIVGAALALSRTSPSPVLGPLQSMYTGLLRLAGERGLHWLMLGTGGDELLNVDPEHGADCLAALDLVGLWKFVRACQRTSPFGAVRVARAVLWRGALMPELAGLACGVLERVSARGLDWLRRRRRRRALPGWVQPPDRTLAAVLDDRRMSTGVVELARGERCYVRVIRGLMQAPLVHLERDQGYAWARQLGFTLLFPYFDRDLVELSLRIPPQELIAGGRHKAPLRRLAAARLPSVALRARKVDFTETVHPIVGPAGRAAGRALGGPARLAELGVVDARRVERFMGDYFEGRSQDWLHAWLVLSTEAWLRARSGISFMPTQQEGAA